MRISFRIGCMVLCLLLSHIGLKAQDGESIPGIACLVYWNKFNTDSAVLIKAC